MKRLFIIMITVLAVLASPLYAKSTKKTSSAPAETTKNRGKGLRITVPAPNARGLTEADVWAVQVVQDLMTTGLSQYTEMTVIDRSNEALVIEEQKRSEKVFYSDEDYLEVGKITQAQYLLVGSIVNAGGVYRLALSVNDGVTNEIKASFNESVSLNDIQNGNATNMALAKLIPAMGLELSEDELKILSTKVSTAKSNDARTVSTVNLAKGMAAEANKNTVEALAYYASSSSKEAAIRYDKIAVAVSTGNIREDVKNDIEARKEWLKVYKDLRDFINKNSCIVTYDVRPGEQTVDYRTETVSIPFTWSYDVNPVILDVYRQIEKGLRSTGKKRQWETGRDFVVKGPYVNVTFELKNEKGVTLGTQTVSLSDGTVGNALNKVDAEIESENAQQKKIDSTRRFTHTRVSSNNDGPKKHTVTFKKIPYNDITDSLSLGISKVTVEDSVTNASVVNPPLEVVILGQDSASRASATMLAEPAEPAEYGTYKKGDRGPAGGFIVEVDKKGFKLNGKTYHYVEVAPLVLDINGSTMDRMVSLVKTSGQFVKKIGDTNISQSAIGDGYTNTNILLEVANEKGYSDIVKAICSFSYGGFDDWFIPGKQEIDEVGLWLNWSDTSGGVGGRNDLYNLFTWTGAVSLQESGYKGSQYSNFNLSDFKGYWDIERASCILFVRLF